MPLPPVIQVKDVGKDFSSGGLFRHRITAVREVSLGIAPGRTMAVVGESGCGKTTLARLAAGLLKPDCGVVEFDGRKLADWPRKNLRRRLQMVFQDADGSLNPNLKTKDLLMEPMRLHAWSRDQAEERIPELLDMVGLTPDLLHRYPHEMSGGQRQRIGLARAMSLRPELVIADEPVASLDRSVQAHILDLFDTFQKQHRVAYLYISHDMSTVRVLADNVAIMLGGVFVETGPVEEVFNAPAHPYTQLLLQAVDQKTPPSYACELEQETSSSQGCPFAALCPHADTNCRQSLPPPRRDGT